MLAAASRWEAPAHANPCAAADGNTSREERSSNPLIMTAGQIRVPRSTIQLDRPSATNSRQQDHLLPRRDLANVPRPWDIDTCETPQLRKEVWSSLEAVVTWLNHEYVWNVADVIPHYWPQHPHLVDEIAVLADQRHRAGQALTSEGAGGVASIKPALLHRTDADATAEPLSRRSVVAGQGPLHPQHRRSELPQAGDSYAADVRPCSRNLITLSRHDLGLLILTQARSSSSSTA